jgi:hypothetical protein
MLHMQLDAFGPTDLRCLATSNKLTKLQNQDIDMNGDTGKLVQILNEIPFVEARLEAAGKAKRTNSVLKLLKKSMKKKK